MAPPVEQVPSEEYRLSGVWGLGSGLVSRVPWLGDLLGEVRKKDSLKSPEQPDFAFAAATTASRPSSAPARPDFRQRAGCSRWCSARGPGSRPAAASRTGCRARWACSASAEGSESSAEAAIACPETRRGQLRRPDPQAGPHRKSCRQFQL